MIRILAGVIMLTPFLSARADVADLQWLAGCWSQDGREAGSVEQWMAPAGGVMLGMSRTVSGGKTVAFEYLRIVEEEDGWIVLIASPSGQETARFRMVSMSEYDVVFENKEHDSRNALFIDWLPLENCWGVSRELLMADPCSA